MAASIHPSAADTLAANDESPLLPPPAEAPVPAHWTAATRFGFRAALLYFFTFLFCAGNGTLFSPFGEIPGLAKIVEHIERGLMWPLNQVAVWAAVHVFHVTGIGATFHETGSGDTAVQWVLQLVFVIFSVAGAAVWTAIAVARRSPRREYQTLYAWLRFLLRLTIGMQMLGYGFAKLFPSQMPPISLAVLNEPVGQSSPMTLLWSLIGMNPAYEMICGAAEVIGGLLILFRRTALAGALLSAFVMTNVLLYNLFFDVPVKLFAANLLLALVFVILPDMKPLYSFFWLHKPAAPAGIWVPPATRRGFKAATRTVEIVFLAGFLLANVYDEATGWRASHANMAVAAPLIGIWKMDPGTTATGAFRNDGQAASEFTIDSPGRGFTRTADGELWRSYSEAGSESAHTADQRVRRRRRGVCVAHAGHSAPGADTGATEGRKSTGQAGGCCHHRDIYAGTDAGALPAAGAGVPPGKRVGAGTLGPGIAAKRSGAGAGFWRGDRGRSLGVQARHHNRRDKCADVAAELEDTLDQAGRNVRVLLRRLQKDCFQVGVQVAVHHGHLELVLVVRHGANAAENSGSAPLPGKIDKQAVKGGDGDVAEGRGDFRQHFRALFRCKQRPALAAVFQHRNNQRVEQTRAAGDDVQVAVRRRVKGAGIDGADRWHYWPSLRLRARSNSSPGSHSTVVGCCSTCQPSSKPKRAMRALPLKSIVGS